MDHHVLALFSMPGGMEWIVILVIGLLLFGRRLPDVARSVGKSIVEFKKGIKDVSSEIDEESNKSGRTPPQIERKAPEGTSSREPAESISSH